MKFALIAFLICIAPLAHAKKEDPAHPDFAHLCKGVDALTGNAVSFKVAYKNFENGAYQTQRVKHIRIGLQARQSFLLTDGVVGCAENRIPYTFEIKDGAFHFAIPCRYYPFDAKGACIVVPPGRTDGENN